MRNSEAVLFNQHSRESRREVCSGFAYANTVFNPRCACLCTIVKFCARGFLVFWLLTIPRATVSIITRTQICGYAQMVVKNGILRSNEVAKQNCTSNFLSNLVTNLIRCGLKAVRGLPFLGAEPCCA